MSIQAIMLDIITTDEATVQAIVAAVPLIGDSRLWETNSEHQAPTIIPDFIDPTKQRLMATFRCKTEVDQAQITENIIQVIMDNISNIGLGSKVKLHLCFHDESPPKGCEEQIMYEVQ